MLILFGTTQSPRPSAGDSSAVREAELIARIVAGERELLHELVRPYEKAVYFAAFAVLQNPQDAEDTAQETVLKVLKSLHQFRGDSKFSTWLIMIAINEARARLRHPSLGLSRSDLVAQPFGQLGAVQLQVAVLR